MDILIIMIANKFLVFCTLNVTEKFVYLVQNSDAQIITQVPKFVHHLWTKYMIM